MKTTTLLLTTVLSTGLVLGYTLPSFSADSITTSTIKTAVAPVSAEAIADPRVAATSFVEHVNYARVALAMKNTVLATQHIAQARNMITLIKDTPTEKLRMTEVGAGRVVYQYDTEYKYYYFPIQTGPVEVKQIDNGPVWAKNDLAVTDADIVYLSLDLTGNKAADFLTAADTAITAGKLKDADVQLAKLTEAVVSVDSKATVPSAKAADNIALARNFIAGKNYEGARYALKHADVALDEMQKDDTYKEHRAEIISMRKDVSDLQGYIDKKSPTMIQKADAKLAKWWTDMKAWTKSEK
jgi:hypothetical protein